MEEKGQEKSKISIKDFELKEETQSLYKAVKDNPKDKIEVEIGDSKESSKIYPQAKIMRWDNEVNFSLRYKDYEGEKSESVESKEDTFVWSKGQKEVHIYEKPEIAEDGGLEIEVVLKEKPVSNVIEFSIETKGLDFFYQPELEDSEVEDFIEREKISIEEAKRKCRPENIVGSYAVYHSTKRDNFSDKEYKTGKFCHIYRPLVKDSKGDEIWGELNIDIKKKLLTITIDEKWLEKAIYPVIVDPTFGYTTQGASSFYTLRLGGCIFTSPSNLGTVDSISIWAGNFSGGHVTLAVYTGGATKNFVSNSLSSELTLTSDSAHILTHSYSTKPTLSASTDYCLSHQTDTLFVDMYYDSGDTGQAGLTETTTPTIGDASYTFYDEYNRKVSIYVTYTDSSGTEANSERGLYLEGASAPVEGWYNSSWDYRVKMTIDNTKVDTTLSDFPVYVDLSDLPAGFHTNCNQTDARDIRVTRSDGETECPREVVYYDSANDKGELHFLANSISSSADTDFYIYYGNASATEPASDATYGSENVWDSNYEAVYHLQQAPTTAQVDSTANNHTSTGYTGSMDSNDSVSATMGKGLDFDGGDDSVVVDDTSQDFQVTSLTVSCWIKSSGFSEAGSWGIISSGAPGTVGSWTLGILSPSQAPMGHWEGSDNSAYNANGTTDVIDGTDHFIYMINNGTTNKVYCDGNEDGTVSTSGKTVKTGSWDLELGGWSSATRSYEGILDEVRISKTARSTDWMTTEYNNQSAPDTFLTIGTAESQPSSGGNSERELYIEGYDIGNSERGLYIEGAIDSNSERGLYLEGYVASTETDSERNLYISGYDTSNSERPLYIQGYLTSNSERNIYLEGFVDSLYSRESDDTLGTDDSNLTTTFSTQDYTDVGTDNDTYVDLEGTSQYLEFLFKEPNGNENNTDDFKITWKGKSSLAPSSSTIYLQIYNRDTESWEALTSNSSASANTKFTLESTVNTDLSDYYDENYLISCRVYQEVT